MNAPLKSILTDADLAMTEAAMPKRKIFDPDRASAVKVTPDTA